MVSLVSVKDRLIRELFAERVLDNTMRGYWCESMVAEALGPECKIVSAGWHAWDLQIGPDNADFPHRIRIQIKNSARIQPWNVGSGRISDCQYELSFRKKAAYFDAYSAGVPCEEYGFMCDVYVLCYHDVLDPVTVNHLDPDQWKFFLFPVVGPFSGLTESELKWSCDKVMGGGRPAKSVRRPETLVRGIRGRPAIEPVTIDRLTVAAIREAVGCGS